MGGCIGKNQQVSKKLQTNLPQTIPKPEPKEANKPLSKLSQLEINMIELTYNDLAKRCKDSILSRETFQIFFHANGLMAQLMFSKFDKQKNGTISKEQFMHAFAIMVKGTFEQKASALFQFYSMQRSAGIGYQQLLRILFSYPLEELNKMLFDDKFLKEIGDLMVAYYFGPQKKICEKTILEENSQESQDQSLRKGSVYVPNSSEYIQIQGRIKEIFEQEKEKNGKNSKLELPALFKKQKSNPLRTPQSKEACKLAQSSSMTLIELKKIRKTGKLKSNISSVTKRYANFLFTQQNLDKDVDFLNQKQFIDILKNHPSIFDAYLAGFHTYIWQINSSGQPECKDIPSEVQSTAKVIIESKVKTVYLRLKRTTIFIYESQESNDVQEVICLQGLIVQANSTSLGQQGLKIKHRDGLYPQKFLIFNDNKQIWVKKLQHYKENSIFDNYLKLQRIGKGNFSNVFKGKHKQTGNEVAVKMIEPKKLNKSQQQVLKRQIGILKQCHHPNIVKFIQEYRTSEHIYIVTELLSQGDLFEYTRRNSFLQEYEAAVIFRQLTETIIYLNNELGIIHRDLKPENVMIKMTKDKKMVNRVKLIDFGFGVYKDKLDGLSQLQKYAGTPGFIAPEVYLRQNYDQKIDTFSLGIILYFLLYGYLPFQSNYFEEIQQQTLSLNISLNNNHWSNVSNEAKNLIYKILTFAPQRISTKEILDHPWLKNIENLKQYQGRNKKRIHILD